MVFDTSSQNYLSALLDTLDVEGFYAQSTDDFIALICAQKPHLALLHVFNLQDIKKIKSDPGVAGTPIVILNTLGYSDLLMDQADLVGPIIEVPTDRTKCSA